jgi:phosphate starvation-inducible PhoH-like protein
LSEIILTIDGVDLVELYGENNVKLNLLQRAFPDVAMTARGSSFKLSGDKKQAQAAKAKIELLVRLLKARKELPVQTVEDVLLGDNPYEKADKQEEAFIEGADKSVLLYGRGGKAIKAKTPNQKKLIEASEANDVVFAVGPAGTGKTYTAVALAVRALKNRRVRKIILTRPAVEAGENLGFLPGDLKDKIDPYLRPLYDALDDMLPVDKLAYFMENRIIEIAPLAFMRGRTLDNAFIILDEAQNSTSLQLKMFLTRLGPSAKCIITGDLSQVDLPYSVKSGLRRGIELLGDIEGIASVYLTADDVVRHRLVKEVIRAYDKADEYAHQQRLKRKEEAEEAVRQQAISPETLDVTES